MRVLVAGGGTGGHLYPGIAVAREFMARVPGAEVTFVGTAQGIESRVVPHEGFALDVIRSGGLKGKSLTSLARGMGLLPLSASDAWEVVARRQPSVVIGVGGDSPGPGGGLAALRGSPPLGVGGNPPPRVANPPHRRRREG